MAPSGEVILRFLVSGRSLRGTVVGVGLGPAQDGENSVVTNKISQWDVLTGSRRLKHSGSVDLGRLHARANGNSPRRSAPHPQKHVHLQTEGAQMFGYMSPRKCAAVIGVSSASSTSGAVARHSRARGGGLGRRILNVLSAGYLSVRPIGRSY